MKQLNNFLDEKLTDQLGIECFKDIFAEITKSASKYKVQTEHHNLAYDIREKHGLQRGVHPVYQEVELFLDGYVKDMEKYEWNIEEEISTFKNSSKIDLRLLKSIPLLNEINVTNICVKYNGVLKCLVVCNNQFVTLIDI